MERDDTVREDESAELVGERSSADQEIHNLVAIPVYIGDDFAGVVVCANRDGGFEELDDDVLLALGDHAGTALHNSRLHGELRTSYVATVRMLADAIEAKDPFLRAHSDEVSDYVAAVADRLELPPRRREELVFASLLHDVGKIGISERILLKPGRLTAEERGVIELHPRIGYRIVEQVPALRSMTGAILHHHERYDGDGYPSGLRGEEIPLEARVVCVADCFSAMTSDRPYRDRMSVEDACAELERCAGTQFDPARGAPLRRGGSRDARRATQPRPRSPPPCPSPRWRCAATARAGARPRAGGAHRQPDPALLAPPPARDRGRRGRAGRRAATPFGLVMVRLDRARRRQRSRRLRAGDEVLRTAGRALSARGRPRRRDSVPPRRLTARPRGTRRGVRPEAERLACELAAELAAEGHEWRQ